MDIDIKDVRIDTFRYPEGGYPLCVRATHMPTGTVVEVDSPKGDNHNKQKALELLQLKLEGLGQ